MELASVAPFIGEHQGPRQFNPAVLVGGLAVVFRQVAPSAGGKPNADVIEEIVRGVNAYLEDESVAMLGRYACTGAVKFPVHKGRAELYAADAVAENGSANGVPVSTDHTNGPRKECVSGRVGFLCAELALYGAVPDGLRSVERWTDGLSVEDLQCTVQRTVNNRFGRIRYRSQIRRSS